MRKAFAALVFFAASLAGVHAEQTNSITVDPRCVQTDDGMAPLYQGLTQEIQWWRDKLGGSQLNSTHLSRLLSRLVTMWANPINTEFLTVLIRDNKWYFPLRDWGYDADCERQDDWCPPRLRGLQNAFKRWVAAGVTFPNALFLVNPDVAGPCTSEDRCPAPAFALHKTLTSSLPLYGAVQASDRGAILIPDMSHPHAAPLVTVPWASKTKQAIFRGPLHCPHTHANALQNCSRKFFVALAKAGDARSQLLNVDAWEDNDPHQDLVRDLQWPHTFAAHAFTLALDGPAGYERLEELLRINSVILKEASPVRRYFEVGLVPGTHYLPILNASETDAFDAMAAVTDADAERITAAAQDFAARFLCDNAKMLYVRRAITEYKSLFSDMDAWIEAKVWPLLQAKMKLGLGHYWLNARPDSPHKEL